MNHKEIVLVTGCSGFIGSAVMATLATHYNVIGLDKDKPDDMPGSAEFVEIDLSSDESVDNALQQVKTQWGSDIASVIHLAAYFDLSGKPDKKYEDITVQGTARLLKSLQDCDVGQFIFSSTMLVHKPGKKINEDSPMGKKFPYRDSKIKTEEIIHKNRGNIPVVILRPAGVYNDNGHNAFLAHQIARIYENRLIGHIYPGDVKTGQSFLHIEDLLSALSKIIKKRKELPDELTLLLGEEEVVSVGAFQEETGRILHGKPGQTWQIPKFFAKAGVWLENKVMGEDRFIKNWMVDSADDDYTLDIFRAKQLLFWEPVHSLRETLPKILHSLQENPEHWYKENKLNTHKVAARSAKAPDSYGDMQAHMEKMHQMHMGKLWVHFTNIMLGLWLAASPFILDSFFQTEFSSNVLAVTADRELASPVWRMHMLGWSDVISGILIAVFGTLSLWPRFSWAQWANTAIGVWLLFAPMVFWSPDAAVYLNDILVGAFVIAFSVLVPMMPGMNHEGMMDENDIPPGWTYSPSTYGQRIPIIALGFLGFIIAHYLTAYQLGHIVKVWDPFFGVGTARIITSDISKAWPVPDAGLGAVSYMFEVLMGIMGSSTRWRTMPWMVLGFGIVVVPLGAVSIFFIIIQPIVIGTWCSLCLLAALAMVVMIPFTLDEVVASCQFLYEVHRRKLPFWKHFFQGGAMPGGSKSKPLKRIKEYTDISDLAHGISWQLVACCLIGLMLMFTRLVFGTEAPMADSDHLIGSLVIVVAISAMAEVGRPLRFINILFGLWLVIAPFILKGENMAALWFSVIAGLALVWLSLPLGRRSKEHYGSWDRFVF